MSAEAIAPVGPDATTSDGADGGAGRGGSQNGSGSPLVVVQQGRGASPPRPAPSRSSDHADNSLRNGYAAISHSVSGETAAIGLGFLLGGPIGAIIGGTIAPAALAALMWRSREAEHDANSNDTRSGNAGSDRSGSRTNAGGTGNQGRSNGSGSNGSQHKTPKTNSATDNSAHKKPKTKDPIADKLSKLGKDLGNKLKNRDKHAPHPKHSKDDKSSKGPKGPKNSKTSTDPKTPKVRNNGNRDVTKRGKQPDSDRPWRDRGHKDKPGKKRKDTAGPTGKRGPRAGDNILGESIPDGLPPRPGEDRIALVRAKRERDKRRQAVAAGKKASQEAARDGNLGDPHRVKLEVIREHNRRIDLELHYENQRLALTAAAETPRSTPVNYPAIKAAPIGDASSVAVARQVDFRDSTAYAILRAMAEQIAHGLHHDDAADMADHIVELTGIPNMCKNLSVAVQEAARALARTAPLHPSVIKHLNNAAIAARSAGVMADNIMIVFVQAHREDIIRVLDPRIGEERWNLRNGPGTLDAAKLRAAISSAHTARLALPAGTSPAGGQGGSGGSKLVPASDGSTKKLINLMKNFTRGHMVDVLSEVAGAAAGVEAVADSVTKLYRRMANTWPTEGVVDDTVRATASKVRSVSDELKKAIKAAQRAHQRELRLNAKPRKGARAESKWDVAGRRSSN